LVEKSSPSPCLSLAFSFDSLRIVVIRYQLVDFHDAGVAELVDARDLKSLVPKERAGSSPASGMFFFSCSPSSLFYHFYICLTSNCLKNAWRGNHFISFKVSFAL
jgi:hypothetical protein